MEPIEIGYLKRQLKRLSSGDEMWFWFLREAADGNPWLCVERREDMGKPKYKDARAKTSKKLHFVGTVQKDDSGDWEFRGDGTATPRQVREDFRGYLVKLKDLSPFAEKLRGANIVPNAVQSEGVSFVAMQRSRLLWAKTRDDVRNDLRALKAKIDDDEEADNWEKQIPALVEQGVLKVFDNALTDALDKALNAEGDERARLNKLAAAELQKYRDALPNNDLLELVDNQDWINLDVTGRLDKALKKLAKDLIV